MSTCSSCTTGNRKCLQKSLLVLIALGALAAGVAIARGETVMVQRELDFADLGVKGLV